MIKRLFLIVLGLAIGPLTAQDVLHLKDGSVIEGSVIQTNKAKVYFEDSNTGDRKWYKKNIEKLIDDTDGNKIEYKVRDIKGLEKVFTGELVKGAVSYYVVEKYNAAIKGYMQYYYIYKEGNSKVFKDLPNSLTSNYIKRMSKYFSDCPSLVKLVEQKEFTYKTTKEAIIFYNSNCSK
ncbi:MAG: hypothetical protein KUG68_09465 [Flavobacteriaceae bacterium]|nr:hypothetical protein [Flavobacteriaceae bacterium]